MNEVTEMWKEHKDHSHQKREKNRRISTQILKENGVNFESKNGGAHLIVQGKDSVIDFWPGTGKYISRDGKKGRGIFNMLRLC